MGLKNTYQARKRFTKVPVSKTGMWYQDGDVVVPSNQITMKGPNGESNYFNSPIMGTGMQSGQTQVMYPGREYSFPNDNSVYETKMQDGGLFPVGPYDEMMAPKQGNYLQPDINRPYYIDDFGGMRSEYKMGFSDNGKETLIPTVVQGRQLTEDQAINNYFKTGLHMGKYNSVDDAEYASKMRTAKYNMFQDPVRFQMQKGGATPIYVSNPNDPRLRSYNDSLSLYNLNKNNIKDLKYIEDEYGYDRNLYDANWNKFTKNWDKTKGPKSTIAFDNLTRLNKEFPTPYRQYTSALDSRNTVFEFKKPVQPIQYKPVQKQVSYPNQQTGRGMTRTISKNINSIQKSNPTPIYVNDPNDPRLKAYNDSLNLYKRGKEKLLFGKNNPNATNAELNIKEDKINKSFPVSKSSDSFGRNIIKSYGMSSIGTGSSARMVPLYKEPVQPIKYADPKIVAKQQQLIDAGYNIGTADGIWGKKSQQAWDQMSTPKQTSVQSYKSSNVPVKSMYEEDVIRLKQAYKDNSNSNFRSSDNIFNNLQKSLGRRPSVSEYNKAIEQYNQSNRSMQMGGLQKTYKQTKRFK